MYRKPSKKKELIRQVIVSVIMVSSVVLIVLFITMFMLGYRFNTDDGNLEQYGVMQFSSIPSGAMVSVDGKIVSGKTPNKTTVAAGEHNVIMWRDGYEKWSKTVDVKEGALTWLNYTLLIPTDLAVEPVQNHESISMTLASPSGNGMLIQKASDKPIFDLVDLSSDTVKTTELIIPTSLYSTTQNGAAHTFQVAKWDDGGRYVLIKHTYGAGDEWLVMDTQDIDLTKNITQLFEIPISQIVFLGTSGNVFYALNSSDIRKLDLSNETISKPLVSNVISFDIYNKSKVITYIGNSQTTVGQRVVGVYRDGDEQASIIRTVTSAVDVPLHIATAHYFNEDYVAISEGKKVDIMSGSYPNTTSDVSNNMKVIGSYESAENVVSLSFSPSGEYVFALSGGYFASYDLEYQTVASSTIEGSGDAVSIKWLDDNHVWSDRGGQLTIREFDGANAHTINTVLVGQDAILTHNGRYLYSIGKTDSGYQLQRVRMILP